MAPSARETHDAGSGRQARSAASLSPVQEQFIRQSEDWIHRIVAEMPEAVMHQAMSDDFPSFEVADLASGVPLDQAAHKALLLRYMREVHRLVRAMPADLLVSTLAAPSDFGALVRALSDPRTAEASREVDPMAGAVGRSIEHQRRLTSMAGEMLTSSQVEDLLGIRRQAIDKRRSASRILALRRASDWLYPAFQFARGAVLPGIEAVLQAHGDTDPWVILDMLLAPDDALGGRTLLQCIEEGDAAAVARHIAQAEGNGFA
ncbi:hypothetical protein [Rhodobacter sp. NSM]|uniref:hypothetical protein n=1 Tax=Rhodobacter sp. NSM TaxID=3457501 RepID=UPI003FD28391